MIRNSLSKMYVNCGVEYIEKELAEIIHGIGSGAGVCPYPYFTKYHKIQMLYILVTLGLFNISHCLANIYYCYYANCLELQPNFWL